MDQEGIKAKIINRQMLTDDIIEITIETYKEAKITPWQWGLFLFEDEKWPFERAYSIIDQDTDNEKTMIIFAIKLIGDDRWYTAIRKTRIGNEIHLKWIFWHFILQDTPVAKVFVWTGIGILPLINMAKYCATEKTMFFSVPYKKDVFYEEKIKKIHGLDCKIHVSREALSGDEKRYMSWRIDFIKEHFDLNTEFYVSWKPEIVDDIIKKLNILWYKLVYTEKF